MSTAYSADFTGFLLSSLPSDRTIEHVTQWDIFALIQDWHGPIMKKAAEMHCDGGYFWRNIPVLPGAQDAVEQLRRKALIKVVTSPWHECPEWGHARYGWLKKNFDIGVKDVVIAANKTLIRGDMLIDDRSSHIKDWSAASKDGIAVLFDAPYNRELEWPYRIDWSESGLARLHHLLEAK